jgi:hypothetical protein
MLLSNDKKRISTVVLGKLKEGLPGGGTATPVGPEPESDSGMGEEAAMRKFIGCVKSDDPKGAAAALSDFLDLHESGEEEAAPGGMPGAGI